MVSSHNMRLKKSLRKICLKVILFSMLFAWLLAFLFPGGAGKNWQKAFQFCGLGDFSACAAHSPFSLHVLNVGKADSIFVQCGSHTLLIDGGTPDCGPDVTAYLKRRGTKSLDLVVNTHPDSDHIGGLKSVLQAFSVKRYFCPRLPQNLIPKTQEYADVQSALKGCDLSSEHPKAGTTLHMGQMEIEVLGPVKQGEDTNNNSIIIKITFGKTSFLLTGDAETQEENSIIDSGTNLKADVLKVGHHGSSTSTSKRFLEAVLPRYAVISVGSDSNELPRLDVSQRLVEADITVYRTDTNGTVIFLSDGESITVKTEKT